MIFKRLVKAYIFPICDYACPVWSPSINRSKKEMINLTIASYRFFLGVNSLHPIPALENDMGRESATERQRLQTLLYFRKIMIIDPNRICYKVLL